MAEAERAGRDPAAMRGAIFLWGSVDEDAARSRREVVDEVSTTYQQDFDKLADRYLLHGTPDEAVARIAEYNDAGSYTVVFAPVAEQDRRDPMLRLFADEVLPRLRD